MFIWILFLLQSLVKKNIIVIDRNRGVFLLFQNQKYIYVVLNGTIWYIFQKLMLEFGRYKFYFFCIRLFFGSYKTGVKKNVVKCWYREKVIKGLNN